MYKKINIGYNILHLLIKHIILSIVKDQHFSKKDITKTQPVLCTICFVKEICQVNTSLNYFTEFCNVQIVTKAWEMGLFRSFDNLKIFF